MSDRRPGDVPRLWRDQPPAPNYPQDPFPPHSLDGSDVQGDDSYSWREWFADLPALQQIGYGCIGVIIVSILFLYCVGASTVFVRPLVQGRVAASPPVVVLPTLAPTPTQPLVPTGIIPLPSPPGTMPATPTQAPLPTLVPRTGTPTFDPNNPYTPTPSTSTTRPIATVVPTARP